MTPLVSEELMEQTWRRVAAASRAQIQALQQARGKEQEELMGFSIGFSSRLRPDALGLVLYMHVVIAEAFRRTGAKFRPVKPGRIMSNWEQSLQWGRALSGTDPSDLERHVEQCSEPAVMRYVLGAMTEENGPDPVELSDEEFWHSLAMMRTIAECMHAARTDR